MSVQTYHGHDIDEDIQFSKYLFQYESRSRTYRRVCSYCGGKTMTTRPVLHRKSTQRKAITNLFFNFIYKNMEQSTMIASGTFGKPYQEDKSFSLLDDDDDEKQTKKDVTNTEEDILTSPCSSNGFKYDLIVEQTIKLINEMEQIRDSMVWHQVENTFHMDRLCMLAMASGDENDNVIGASTCTQ